MSSLCLACYVVALVTCVLGAKSPLDTAGKEQREIAAHTILRILDRRNTGLDLTSTNPIFQDRDDQFWIASSGQLYLYNEGMDKWRSFKSGFSSKAPYYTVETIGQTGDGRLWFGSSSSGLSFLTSVTVFDAGGWRLLDQAIDLGAETLDFMKGVHLMFPGRKGVVWFLFPFENKSYLTSYDGLQWSAAFEVPSFVIWATAGFEDAEGQVWLGTNSDIGRFDGAKHKWSRSASPKDVGPPRHIYQDRKNRIWLADLAGSIAVFDKTTDAWTSYNIREFLPASAKMPNRLLAPHGIPPTFRVTAIYQDQKGQMMFATSRGLLILAEAQNQWLFFSPENSALPGAAVTAILEDRFGKIWLGTSGGIAVLKP